MERICERANLNRAYKRVKANQGAPGVDGMTVDDLYAWLVEHKEELVASLLGGSYQPQPVRGKEIPKPGGGVRQLGIPTVVDRLVQQAILQVLEPLLDPTFSASSYGFRPRRGAHQALRKGAEYVRDGRVIVVDIDLEKFFDRVNHDVLMARLARRVADKRLLRIVRRFLEAGMMQQGVCVERYEGTPQGGPLSPLLANLLLDDLDKELERRGQRFCRYADDCNIYVRSRRAGQRVMASIEQFITRKLKLKVNLAKSAVARPWERKFLGFTFTANRRPKRRIAPKALARFSQKVRELTRRTRGISVETMVRQLATYLRGWRGYFGFCQTPSVLRNLDSWIRRRLRCFQWKQWKRGRRRFAALRRMGVGKDLAAQTAGSSHGPWRISRSPALSYAMPGAFWERLGLPRLQAR
ncbi:MAG: group II intron reverse transcriptase/maturase [Candidatus Brocadiae bacterium]|nr:group II intron reverse transcriptase/maturase [Candidatus Brocadiia bacterium]